MTDDGRVNPASGFDRLCEWSIYTASHNKLGGAAAMPQHPFSTISVSRIESCGQWVNFSLCSKMTDSLPSVLD
jgi:hypothetical protein